MDEPQTSNNPPQQRCAPHGLTVGADGLCIRCRRVRGVTTDPHPESEGTGRGAWLLAALGLAGAIALGVSARAPAVPDAIAPILAPKPGASVTVLMYSTSWCGYCRRARAWLDSRGIVYVDHDVERESEAREHLRSINPRGGVPTFEIDQQVLLGFDAGQLERMIAQAAERRAGR